MAPLSTDPRRPEEVGKTDASIPAVTAMTFLILMCKVILSAPSGLSDSLPDQGFFHYAV